MKQAPEKATDLLTEILKDKGWRVLSFKDYAVATKGKVSASWPHLGFTGDFLECFVNDPSRKDVSLIKLDMGVGHGPLAQKLLSY